MPSRKSDLFLRLLAAGGGLLAALLVHAHFTASPRAPQLETCRFLVDKYGLTDLCLFTDARYTRHPAVADQASPFQDHPTALEHFPSGTLLLPPVRRPSHVD